MPVILRYAGSKFFFYSNEGDPREPIDVHVRTDGGEAKFWIKPVSVAWNHGFDDRTRAWDEYLG